MITPKHLTFLQFCYICDTHHKKMTYDCDQFLSEDKIDSFWLWKDCIEANSSDIPFATCSRLLVRLQYLIAMFGPEIISDINQTYKDNETNI